MKKIIILILCLITSLCITGCKDSEKEKLQREYEEYVKQFDLSDEKIPLKVYEIDDISELTDKIIIITKLTKTYPKLKMEFLGIPEITGFEYHIGPKPPTWYYQVGNEDLLENFRQTIWVYFYTEDLTKKIEILETIYNLDFVKEAKLVTY